MAEGNGAAATPGDERAPIQPPSTSSESTAALDSDAAGVNRTLYLAGVGEALGTDMEELRRMLEAFGPLDDDDAGGQQGDQPPLPPPPPSIQTFAGKGYVLARFRAPADAARARKALDGQRVQGRPLTAQFSTITGGGDEATEPPPEPLDPADCADVVIPGLELAEDVVSPEEEAALLAFADRDEGGHWAAGAVAGIARRVQHYGHAFDYATRGIDFASPCAPVPLAECPALAAVVARLLGRGLLRMVPDQMTLNEYHPGQGIAGHVETHDAFRDGLLSLSLGAAVVMDFREPATGQRKALRLPPRSALALQCVRDLGTSVAGEARYLWAHAIAARTWDKVDGARVPRSGRRVSFTLRRVIPPLPHAPPGLRTRRPCLCPFPDRCPSSPPEARAAYLAGCRRGDAAVVPPEAVRPTPLERSNVHAVYETISTHWNHTRAIRRVHWPRVVGFLQSLPPHALIADIGCGDGKYLELRRYGFHATGLAVGCDRSVRLLACAARQRRQEQEQEQQQEEGQEGTREGEAGGAVDRDPPPEVFACDVLQVPFRDGAFDAALCIAVLHHLSTEAHRVQALRELCRVVRVGGVFDLHVWALEQEDGSRRRFDDQDQLVPFRMQAKYAAQPLEALAAQAAQATATAATTTTQAPTTTAAAAAEAAAATGVDVKGATKGPPRVGEAVPARVDAQAKLVTYERYCHVYREWELEGLLNSLGNEVELQIVDRGYDKGNWFVTVRKLRDDAAACPGSSMDVGAGKRGEA